MKKIISILLAGAMLLTGCSGTSNTNTSSVSTQSVSTTTTSSSSDTAPADDDVAPAARTIIDTLGYEVELPENPQKIIITLAPLLHVYLAVGGSTDNVVAVLSGAITNTILTDIYDGASDIGTGFSSGSNMNLEEILAYEPDLILYSPLNAIADAFPTCGVPAVAFPVSTFDNGNAITPTNMWIEYMSIITGNESMGESIIQKSEDSLAYINEKIDGVEPITSAYLSVTESGIKVLGSGVFGSFWTEIAGTYDVAAENISGSTEISLEELYNLNPDMIFLSYTSMPLDDFMQEEAYQNLDAVKNGKVVITPVGVLNWYTPSLDVPLALLWHAQAAYPELFSDLDIRTMTYDHYVEIYDYQLSETELDTIFGE